MKIQTILAFCLAATVALTGCQKDGNESVETKESANIHIRVTPGTIGTRAEAARVQTDPITLGEGHIYFVNPAGVIVKHVEIKSSPSPGDVDLALLTSASGDVVENVSTAATKCYIFSKVPSSVTMPSITPNVTNISTVMALPMEIDDLYDTTGGVVNVPLWGEGNVAYNVAGTELETNVTIQALGSRIQIAQLTGYNDIVSYDVEGIFINNYFEEMGSGKSLLAANITNHLSTVTNYTGTFYDAADAHYIYDESTTTLGQFAGAQTLECTPQTSGSVWAYNIFPTEGADVADETTMPHVIIRFKNVEYMNGSTPTTVAGPLFLTIGGMSQNISGTPTPVEKIKQGTAYTFTDIQFEYDDLTIVPEVTFLDAEVTVTLLPWAEEIVDPEF